MTRKVVERMLLNAYWRGWSDCELELQENAQELVTKFLYQRKPYTRDAMQSMADDAISYDVLTGKDAP